MSALIKLVRLRPDAVLPDRSTRGSVGYDLVTLGEYTIEQEPVLLSTGWRLGSPLPLDVELTIRPRSSLAKNWGLFIPNAPGTIDQDYTGEIKVQVARWAPGVTKLPSGVRVAQLVVSPVRLPNMVEIAMEAVEFDGDRAGFGSTGL